MSNKLFNEYAIITTKDKKIYNIQKERIYIGGKTNYYGKLYVITSNNNVDNKLHIIDEVYSFDNSRLRFLCDIYNSPKKFNTIEHAQNNSVENKITVVESYDTKTNEICSIGNIESIHSDLIDYESNEKKQNDNIFKRLILK